MEPERELEQHFLSKRFSKFEFQCSLIIEIFFIYKFKQLQFYKADLDPL